MWKEALWVAWVWPKMFMVEGIAIISLDDGINNRVIYPLVHVNIVGFKCFEILFNAELKIIGKLMFLLSYDEYFILNLIVVYLLL